MYHAIVRRKARGIFDHLSRGEWRETTGDLADDFTHVFPGNHALGGERHSREAIERWFERLHRLFPDLNFEVAWRRRGSRRRRRPRSPISGGSAHAVTVRRMPAGEL